MFGTRQQQLQQPALPPHLPQQQHYYRRQQHYSTLPVRRPCPEPLPCLDPAPQQQQQDGAVAYDWVHTYGPGCRRVSTSCSPRAASPLDCGHGCDPPQGAIHRIIIENPDQVSCPQDSPEQLDCHFFGELLAELHCKSTDLYSCLLQHVEKTGTRNHNIEFPCQTEDIEELIPKGLSEATKQQICYLLQMRATSDKSLRLVLSTFKNLREELCHLQDDLGKLEIDNVLLKKDLDFKDSQVKEYETMLASLKENNCQQQQGLRDSTAKCHSLEEQLLSLRLSEGNKDCQLKELEYSKRALEQEIQSLKLQRCFSPTLQTTTDELSSRYVEMINNLREDKDREICSLRKETGALQTEAREVIWQSVPGVTAIITKKYRNQYPILSLLSDDYKVTSPVSKSQTIVIERTGEIWKHILINWYP
ncbi:hypothetical protein DUI87_01966 [Hirundo rustica rustica]|uniref:POF1B helix-loop-helix domain-containing protein n=1 Tax=Hirundo rustica rustica TaxID=333673 RepID=A0A3M0L6J8_HIRRU|nr:hypothetical protein DUI87_01966 [Hirundo rustica rustica]